ncbi:MAG TPA: MutS family DNA mismatch repair protein, partial [Ohtaekwangia sp.]|uniref:MutS family DNA mismatch repair protein n=1 Tax=Ohtaekwangia sp. TaxID=2066019 RepID=UPI002F92F5E8
LLYDLQCVYRLEKWKVNHADKLPVWLDVITETEVLCSFGTFAFNHPSFQYAGIHDALRIEIQELSHPLLPEHERVSNDLLIGNNQSVLIVTGANMAGKSTFLRTIGINLVLALNGAPVCAKEFRCPIIQLRTGMRTADSLKDHQSYFYAELNRLKTIMEELRSDKPLLILLDEILKGTNSTDKQAGSIALVKQLLPHPCLAMIATHDLALGDLEKEHPDRVKNFCFEATIEKDQLSFDYKLKPGLAQKMNATFLMKKMGIIPA